MSSANKGKGRGYLWLVANQDHDGDECLIWPFFRKETGYGAFGHLGRVLSAHRFMCGLANGPPPTPTHEAAHECGNGNLGCCNPKHLSWKTPHENRLDRTKHGRGGRRCPGRAKLTATQVDEIRSLLGKETHAAIAKRFGITRGYVYSIKAGLTWRDDGVWKPVHDDDVLAIYRSPEPSEILEGRYGVSRQVIKNIRRGRTYSHLTAQSSR